MTSFTTLSITPLVCNAASKLNWTVYKTTKTVNCKIVNKTLQWFQNKRSSHWRCSIKEGVLKIFALFTGKHLRQSLFLIKLQATPFSTESLWATASGINVLAEIWNQNCSIWEFEDTNLSLQSWLLTNLCKSEIYSIVKFRFKISTIYHQIKLRKGRMNSSSSIKMPFLKTSQYSHKTPVMESPFK